tara:strand:+ start:2310 stop:2579 length:270 start_codon:yes stop_codon:yes gene_type:complete
MAATKESLKRYSAYKTFFQSPQGREIIKDMYRSFGRRQSYVPDSFDKTAFNEGQRNVYLRIGRLAKVDLSVLEHEAEDDEKKEINDVIE